jgi:hypothetical protein
LNDSEILDEKSILCFHTVLAVQESQNCLFGSVEVIDDRFSVVESASCENIDIVVLTHVGQEFEAMRSDIELEFISLMIVGDICLFILVED